MTKDEAIENNENLVNEGGPRLTYSMKTFVVARNPTQGRILIGGLGALGVGQMWFDESDEHKGYPGYSDAEIVDCGWEQTYSGGWSFSVIGKEFKEE